MTRPKVWFFDLDNTLHDASHRVFGLLNEAMGGYMVRHLDMDSVEADRLRTGYLSRYGATLLGLVHHHGVDAQHFLRETHEFINQPDLSELLRSERGLGRLVARLPGRKILVTNAPRHYARKVLRYIGLHRHFVQPGLGFYAIEDMRAFGGLRPKPSRSMLRMMLAREGVHPSEAVLVEDSAANLKSARALGMRTVFVATRTPLLGPMRKTRPPYADLQVKSIAQLLQRQRHLR